MINKLDVVIMAGGKGERLMPFTDQTPKALLKIGEKPIIEYNTDLLASYGVEHIHISVNYLGDQIISYFEKNNKHQISFNFIEESKALGTIGALKKIKSYKNNHILVMNADLLTNVNIEAILSTYLSKKGDALMASIPYKVDIPHGVVETKDGFVTDLKEKPSYTYYSNAGIYIIKKEHLDYIPENRYYNATDLIETLLTEKKKIINYPILTYWLDIGNHDDFEKAQEDIKLFKL